MFSNRKPTTRYSTLVAYGPDTHTQLTHADVDRIRTTVAHGAEELKELLLALDKRDVRGILDALYDLQGLTTALQLTFDAEDLETSFDFYEQEQVRRCRSIDVPHHTVMRETVTELADRANSTEAITVYSKMADAKLNRIGVDRRDAALTLLRLLPTHHG